MLRRLLSTVCFLAFLSWFFFRDADLHGPALPNDVDVVDINMEQLIADQSMTAILPVSASRIDDLADILIPLLGPSKLRDVILVTPESYMAATRAIVREFVSLVGDFPHPDFTLRLWPAHISQPAAVLRASAHSISQRLLVLDETGLTTIDQDTRTMLLNPPAFDLPLGPRGVHRSSCLRVGSQPEPVTYLVPPFVMPRSLAHLPQADTESNFWPTFGVELAEREHQHHGGVAISLNSGQDSLAWCPSLEPSSEFLDTTFTHSHSEPFISDDPLFAVVFPTVADLQAFASVPCSWQERDFLVFLAIYTPSPSYAHQAQYITHDSCTIHFKLIPDPHSYLSFVNRLFAREPDVLISLDDFKPDEGAKSSWISMPRQDLVHSSWMKTLTLQEWQSWHQPRVDVSIITKDRPESLTRLLDSLLSGHLYGDTLNLRINLEQSADPETMDIVQNFHDKWQHGSVFLHHRIVHGGLLPAVVESWYPATDDHYGLLLEDDVELSPMFYAWIKMTLLRYKYATDSETLPQLYGISLYQQKHIEMHPTGRQLFSAPTLFAEFGLPPLTPYLSQIPCSWGALYFPTHWRLFHAYLTLRFSQTALPIGAVVVPDVSSNRWQRSWKRYFVEMAYLRGLVMVYPNFPGLVSLSTNHFEVGAHVRRKDRKGEAMFNLPLMGDGGGGGGGGDGGEGYRGGGGGGGGGVGLLDLPGGELPEWDELPVLNLTGSVLSFEEIMYVGRVRERMLMGCGGDGEVGQYGGSQQFLEICDRT